MSGLGREKLKSKSKECETNCEHRFYSKVHTFSLRTPLVIPSEVESIVIPSEARVDCHSERGTSRLSFRARHESRKGNSATFPISSEARAEKSYSLFGRI